MLSTSNWLAEIGGRGTVGSGMAHSIARPWVPISFRLTQLVYLWPFWSYLAGSKKAFPPARPGYDEKYRSRSYRGIDCSADPQADSFSIEYCHCDLSVELDDGPRRQSGVDQSDTANWNDAVYRREAETVEWAWVQHLQTEHRTG